MLDRINRTSLWIAAAVLLAGCVAAVGTPVWNPKVVQVLSTFSDLWLAVLLGLCAIPILSWPAAAVVLLLRRRRLVIGLIAAAVWIVLAANLTFWGLVQAKMPPFDQLYDNGRVVWVGDRAFLFGHGYWTKSDGFWRHQTLVRLSDGSVYRGSTLELLGLLQQRGAKRVWGSWCYTGNYPYIQKDLVTGRQFPWPSFASYNTSPGVTIPVWLGSAFVRLAWPKDRYDIEPDVVGPAPIDTVYLLRPSLTRVEQSFELMQQRLPGLPRPDSVSWRPLDPDTVRAVSRTTLAALSDADRRRVQVLEREELKSRARTGLALFWIRGRAFPLYIQVPARLHRTEDTFDEIRYASTGQTYEDAGR